jgi:hypothetical protein
VGLHLTVILPQLVEQHRRERHEPLFLALAEDAQDHALAVDALGRQV